MSTSQLSPSPSKPRSLSDVPKPSLSPSPVIREQSRIAKDDATPASPLSPKRPLFPVRGLSLQMPRDRGGPTSASIAPVSLSPKVDSSMTHGAPASMLPRRSRGLEFARACTNLHHSTLAESSPDSSPTIAGRVLQIPRRKSLCSNSVLGSPSNVTGHMWSPVPHSEKTVPSSSVSSINMLDTDSGSTTTSDEGDDDAMDRDTEDPIMMTPQVSKYSTMVGPANSPGAEWMVNQSSPAALNWVSFQRARLRKGRNKNSSNSGNRSKPSTGPLSPPIMKSIEHSNGSLYPHGLTKQQLQSRRESLSLGTGNMHLSDSGEDTRTSEDKDSSGGAAGASSGQSPRGVVRRPVTRRSNLLPKTKNFARIRAALLEEAAPVEDEAKREADVIHQVRENDPIVASPGRQTLSPHEAVDTAEDDDMLHRDATNAVEGSASSFSRHAEKHSDGLRFWNTFDQIRRTPPPASITRKSSSAISEDMGTESTGASQTTNSGIGIFTGHSLPGSRSRSRSSTPLASNAPTAGEAARKANNRKRGRDDDLDPACFKRRAVSPGMSVQSSPVLPQSPSFHGDKSWSQMLPPKTNGERGCGNGGGPTKRIGLQGMVETNDSLMNMSIE